MVCLSNVVVICDKSIHEEDCLRFLMVRRIIMVRYWFKNLETCTGGEIDTQLSIQMMIETRWHTRKNDLTKVCSIDEVCLT